MRASLTLVVCLVCLLGVNNGRADGDEGCTFRQPNDAEADFFRQLASLRAAAPTAPEGWQLREDQRLDASFSGIPEQVCTEVFRYDLELDLVYERIPDPEEDDAAVRRAMDAGPDKAAMAEVEALQAKLLELAQQAVAAGERGDMNAVESLNADMDVLSQQISQKFEELYAPQQAISDQLAWDRSATIDITVNGSGGDCLGNPRPMNIPGGLAYRCAYEDGYSSSGDVLDHASARILVVLGQGTVRTQDWSRLLKDQLEFTDQGLTVDATYDPARPLVVQNVIVSIDGDNAARVDALFQRLQLDPLLQLMER